jgi:anti-sigma factor (TIGR02949 family)
MTKPEIRSCEEALRLLASHLDGELGRGAHEAVERHLSMCRSCYSRWEFERRLKENVAGLRQESVPHAVSDRVQQLIRRFTVAGE